MRKISVMLTALFTMTACNEGFVQTKQFIKTGSIYSEICVDGVIYLRSGNGYLTPKLNRDAMPVECVMPRGNSRASYQ